MLLMVFRRGFNNKKAMVVTNAPLIIANNIF
jgi:hypothetical protein